MVLIRNWMNLRNAGIGDVALTTSHVTDDEMKDFLYGSLYR